MPEKRKRDQPQDQSNKKAKSIGNNDFTSYMLSNYATDIVNPSEDVKSDSDSDSEVEAATFSAFDLPNYGGILSEETEEHEPHKKITAVPGTALDNNIIFVSDPSKLPKPISFTTPTLMNPVVIGSKSQTNGSQVLVMNNTVTRGSTKPAVQPVVVPALSSPPQAGSFSTARNMPLSSSIQVRNTVKSTTNRSMPSWPMPSAQRTKYPANVKAGSSSATDIMQQVMAAAQQAARNIRLASSAQATNKLPQVRARMPQNFPAYRLPAPGISGQNKSPAPQQPIPSQRTAARARQPNASTASRNNWTMPVTNGATTPQAYSAAMDVAKKWKPYSGILHHISKRMSKNSTSRLGINANLPLNLKQMYLLLRRKFKTNQIYDMCLWDMEHPDASLLEIAINNAFD